jgi:hypothetical protein
VSRVVPVRQDLASPVGQSAGHRLSRINLAAAVAFFLGGSLFALGAALAQLDAAGTATVDVTYLVGGVFFSLGGYASILLVVNTTESGTRGFRWWSSPPRDLGERSAVVLFLGTLLFAVSLVAAFVQGVTPRQYDEWVWLPDILGCVCFLVSGHLALLDVCGGRIGVRAHRLGWWVVAVNQVGSVLFFLAGLAAFARPATSQAVDVALVNWGTFAGAVCFAVGGLLQVFDTPTPTRTAVQHHS